MKKILDKKLGPVGHTVKHALMVLVGLSVVYSFGYLPMKESMVGKSCHAIALANAQEAAEQIDQVNSELGEGEEPVQLDQVGVYDVQYTLCVRSRGL